MVAPNVIATDKIFSKLVIKATIASTDIIFDISALLYLWIVLCA